MPLARRNPVMPSCTSAIARGLTNVAVPTWTAEQPATRNSSASSAHVIPPIPITGILTGCLDRAGDDTYVADHRGELHPHGKAGPLSHGLGHRGRGAWVIAEVKAALLHVGARDIDLEPGHSRDAIQSCGQLSIFMCRLAVDVDEHGKVPLRPTGRVIADQCVDSGSLEPDGVEHPAWRLGDARGSRAHPRPEKDAFGGHAA